MMKTLFRLLVILLFILIPINNTGIATPVAATITVTTTTDEFAVGGDCSLREAVFSANNHTASYGCTIDGSGDITILVPAGEYFLTRSGPETLIGESDDLDIVTGMTMTGAGPDLTIINGSDLFRVFDIQAGDDPTVLITISGLTIRNGNAGSGSGGGIRNQSNLTLENVIITGNSAGTSGGGIYHQSNPSVPGSPPIGGLKSPQGILAFAQLSLIDSAVTSNTADGDGGGIANAAGSKMLIEYSLISGNTSDHDLNHDGNGGGINNISEQTFSMVHSQVIGNSAGNAWGGGLFSDGADDVVIEDTLFKGNEALHMGGNIYHSGSGGSMELYRCNIDSGSAGAGGGLAAVGGTTYVINTTFALNTATTGANLGGAIYVSSATLQLMFNTIAENVADYGAAIYNIGGTVSVGHSILAQNHTHGGTLSNCSGTFSSLGYNLSDDNTCSLTADGDMPGTDAGLGNYGRNHAPDENLWTFALLPSSPAIDGCYWDIMLLLDERSFPRPVDGDGDGSDFCDIGAYEAQLMSFLPVIVR
jgi:CSLREA domain-containing protein